MPKQGVNAPMPITPAVHTHGKTRTVTDEPTETIDLTGRNVDVFGPPDGYLTPKVAPPQPELTPAPVSAVPTLTVPERSTRVKFRLPGGSFTMPYALVIIQRRADHEPHAVILGNTDAMTERGMFEPDTAPALDLEIDGQSYTVMNIDIRFRIEPYNLLVLPVVQPLPAKAPVAEKTKKDYTGDTDETISLGDAL